MDLSDISEWRNSVQVSWWGRKQGWAPVCAELLVLMLLGLALWRYCWNTIAYSTSVVPSLFGTRDWFHGRQVFLGLGLKNGFGMISAYYVFCAHYYYMKIYTEIITWILTYNAESGSPGLVLPLVGSLGVVGDSVSHSPLLELLPQLHLTSLGVRFLYGAHNLEPSRMQFTVGLLFSWESNTSVITGMTGSRAQAEMWAMGSRYRCRWDFICSLRFFCCVVQFLTGRGLLLVHILECGDFCLSPKFVKWGQILGGRVGS